VPVVTGCLRIAFFVSLKVYSIRLNRLTTTLVYSHHDSSIHYNRINDNDKLASALKARQRQEVKAVVGFCLNDVDCRRLQLLSHFSETFDHRHCEKTCDNCSSAEEVIEEDFSAEARQLVKPVPAFQRKIDLARGVRMCVFRGKNTLLVECLSIFCVR